MRQKLIRCVGAALQPIPAPPTLLADVVAVRLWLLRLVTDYGLREPLYRLLYPLVSFPARRPPLTSSHATPTCVCTEPGAADRALLPRGGVPRGQAHRPPEEHREGQGGPGGGGGGEACCHPGKVIKPLHSLTHVFVNVRALRIAWHDTVEAKRGRVGPGPAAVAYPAPTASHTHTQPAPCTTPAQVILDKKLHGTPHPLPLLSADTCILPPLAPQPLR